MQEFEKGKIIELWKRGYGSTRIAKALGLNVNTVKSYCRRNGLVGDRSRICTKEESTGTVKPQCKNCGAFIIQRPGTKKKLFCSDKCRMSWWNAHPEMADRRSKRIVTCQNCGKAFAVYGGKTRKFCSHSCYIEKRYRNGTIEIEHRDEN